MTACDWCGSSKGLRKMLGVFLCEPCRVLARVYGRNPYDYPTETPEAT